MLSKTALQQIKEAGGKQRSKYRSRKTAYKSVWYDSELEARVAAWLDLRMGRVCPRCKGSGTNKKSTKDCSHCNGAGHIGGDVLKWERQVGFNLLAYGMRVSGIGTEKKPCAIAIGTYKIDFKVYYTDGTIEYLEVKGFETPLWKLKFAIFKANHPKLRMRIITKADLPKGF